MPYGVRAVGSRRIDFDRVYDRIFEPAIWRVRIDGRNVIPLRSDRDLSSRILVHAMMRDLLSARLALGEISTENRNVHWELGVRHSGVKSGTVLVMLKKATIPFDLAAVGVSRYADTPPAAAEESVGSIAAVLRETLRSNAIDSPAYAASLQMAMLMGTPEYPTKLGEAMAEAETAALNGAPGDAARLYRSALTLEPDMPQLHQRQGILFLDSGEPDLAREAFERVLTLQPQHLDAGQFIEALKIPGQHILSRDAIRVPGIPELLKNGRDDVERILETGTEADSGRLQDLGGGRFGESGTKGGGAFGGGDLGGGGGGFGGGP
jgi:hypothetical protein